MMKIVFIGDSITDANHLYSEDGLGEGYVKIVADELRKTNPDVQILNKGHDGFTVAGLWKFLDYDCISKKPDIVSILIGCNDVSVKMSTGKTLEEQRFEETYEKILKEIRKKTDAKIICMGPFILPHPLEFANWISDIRKAEEMAEMAAGKYDALFLPLHNILQEEALRHGYERITIDGVHLTKKGAAVIAGKWIEAAGNWLDKSIKIS